MSKKPVEITLTELHRRTGDVINLCHYTDQPTVVTKRDRPFVIILSADDWEIVKETLQNEKEGEAS